MESFFPHSRPEFWQYLYALYIAWIGGLMTWSTISQMPNPREAATSLRNNWGYAGKILFVWAGCSYLALMFGNLSFIWTMIVATKVTGAPWSAIVLMTSSLIFVAYLHFSLKKQRTCA